MKLNHPKNIKKLKDVFKNKPVTINYEGCSWEILKYSYKVSKKYNLGFLHLCRDLICFDITKEKILWTLKDLTGTLISFKIVDSKEKIFLEDEYRKRFIEISYDGEIIKNRFGLIDEYRERTYKNSLLKSRQETILSWLCKSEFLRDIEKRDLLSEDKEIYKNFIESKKKFLEENHCSRTHYTIEKNNEKILKKYLSKNFDKFLISKCNNDKSLSSLQTRAGNIVSEFIGKEKYKEMVNEFYRKYEAGEINYSSCALSKYFCRILKNKKPKFEGTKKHCIYCTKLFYPGIIPFILKKYHPKNEPIEFCQSCLVSALWGSYKKKKTKKQAIDDL